MDMHARPGRSCPLSYRYPPPRISARLSLSVETLWVVGGLYGNRFALDALLEAYEADRGSKALVFNGDFHWFDVDAADFSRVNETVLGSHALRGNIETELASPEEGAGCGCAAAAPRPSGRGLLSAVIAVPPQARRGRGLADGIGGRPTALELDLLLVG